MVEKLTIKEVEAWLRQMAKLLTEDPMLQDYAVSWILGEIDLSNYHGRTRLAQILRNDIKRKGLVPAIEDWMRTREHGAFDFAVERGTVEALVVRHPDRFSPEAVQAAKARIENAGLA